MSGDPVGIDFGTSYCTVGVFRNGGVDILKSQSGSQRTPSCVSITEPGGFSVGEDALKEVLSMNPNPSSVFINGVPALIKRRIVQNLHLLTNSFKGVVFDLIENGPMPISLMYKSEPRILFSEQICSLLLSHLKESAEAGFGKPARDAVVSVPTTFSYTHRQALEDACRLAGLNTLRLINAPVAAALAYCFQQKIEGKRNILVFDYGGWNLDLAIVTIEKNGWLVVKECLGQSGVGGEYLAQKIADAVIKEFRKKQQRHNQCANGCSMLRLRLACEEVAKQFSRSGSDIAEIKVVGFEEGIDLKTIFTRAQFEKICEKVFTENLQGKVDEALVKTELQAADIDEVILVGGSSRILKIQELLHRKLFLQGAVSVSTVYPEEAVAIGAAIYAALLRNGDKPKELENIGLIDIMPFSLGVETKRGHMSSLLKMDFTCLTKLTQAFSMDALTHFNDPTILDLKVVESRTFGKKKHNEIGIVTLRDISLAPRDFPLIEVTLEINARGTLRVTVLDRISGNETSDTITTRNYRFQTEECDGMLAEVEEFRADARKQKECHLVKNKLETLCSDVEMTVNKGREDALRLSQFRKALVNKCYSIRGWLATNTRAGKEEVEVKLKELERFCQPLIATMAAPRALPSIRVSGVIEIATDQPPRKRARRHSE